MTGALANNNRAVPLGEVARFIRGITFKPDELVEPGSRGSVVCMRTKNVQADLDEWIREYNEARPHQGRWCFGKTPMQTFLDAMPMAKEKMIAA